MVSSLLYDKETARTMEYLASIRHEDIRDQVASGAIRINTKDDFELPKTQSIPLQSRGKSNLRKIKIWLLDVQDELILEDYYFYMDWLPGKPIIKIPKGFVFNGASVPKPLRIFLSPKGILYAASIAHDFGYQYNAWLTIDGTLYTNACGREFFDEQFRVFNDDVYDMDVIATTSWLALRAFGWIAWNMCRAEKKNIFTTFMQGLSKETL